MIFGVSLDDEAAHRRFRAKESLPFDLLVDPKGELCRLYDVKVTNLLIMRLTARVTYLIGRDGRIRKAFAKVDPQGHAEQVLGYCTL